MNTIHKLEHCVNNTHVGMNLIIHRKNKYFLRDKLRKVSFFSKMAFIICL